jgi:hypothetical protein
MAATVRDTSLASGLGEGQVELSEPDWAQEAQGKVCRGKEKEIADTNVPMAIRPRGVDVDMHPSDSPTAGGVRALADTGDSARAGVAQGTQGVAPQQQGGARWAALMEQAEEAAARLKELMTQLGSAGVAPLATTGPRRVALDARLGPAAECLNTACEDLQAAATQSDPAREQLLRAEAHLSFAKLHMTAAQRLQAPAGEEGTRSGTPLIPAGAQLLSALTEAQHLEAEAGALQASWMQAALRRTSRPTP